MRSSCALLALPHAPLSVLPVGAPVIADLVAELVYASYRANRGYAPAVAPARWAAIYGSQTGAMEQRYQAEQRKEDA